jgi:putative ubiquitin-RnfH superfamily antitoxin RatB of RatAB toxin-antitoxin module
MQIEVVYSPGAGVVKQVVLRLPTGSTVQEALQDSGLLQQFPELALNSLAAGIWGRRIALSDMLRDRDRVEIYRPLQVDPKEARRQRYRSHRAKSTP